MPIGSLGPVVFHTSEAYVRNFQTLDDVRRARFATHNVLNNEQKLQYLGLELATSSIEMNFHHRFCMPAAELLLLRGVLELHKPQALVIGGVPFGEFVLTEVKSTWKQVTDKGELLTARAEVRLKEYK